MTPGLRAGRDQRTGVDRSRQRIDLCQTRGLLVFSGRRAVVVNLANWEDRTEKNNLEPHPPEVTEVAIDLEADVRH